jgi:hypothetical protein
MPRNFSDDLAMAWAIGNPISRQHMVEVPAIKMDVINPRMYISSVKRIM